jgi:sulfatase modifying factor 1
MPTEGFTNIPGGLFQMGAEDGPHPEDGENPLRPVRLAPYRIATTALTNSLFAAFITATAYRTTAERAGASLVFQGQLADPEAHPVADPATPWWRRVAGASWRQPSGAEAADGDLPVVHVSHADALAYGQWSGTRLPTEAEWENAAGPGAAEHPHIFRGNFPDAPATTPGPLAAHNGPANDHGLIHACGNVWEWTADRFTRLHSPRETANPHGPLNGARYVVKGGSFLCCASYCARFRPSSRRGEVPEATTSHTGFRVAALPQ